MSFIPLFVFAFVIYLVIQQPKIKIPFRNIFFTIDYGIAPLLGVALLYFSGAIGEKILLKGIIGNDSIKPYAIIILFNALAYVCISMDITGLFAYLALYTTKAAGNSGRKLFLYFFILSSVLTMFTSNDIVTLTLTPLICYFTRYTKTNPLPYLIGQFFAANIWSTALYIGDPTNIIVAQAYKLSFVEYSAWMLLPTLAAGATCLGLLWIVFYKQIPKTIETPEIAPESALKDRKGAIFSLVCLGLCLIFLSLSHWLQLDIWKICLASCVVMMCRDITKDVWNVFHTKTKPDVYTFFAVIGRMPWKIIPFVLGMFIMVESLCFYGWVDRFATIISALSRDIFSSVFLMGYLSSFVSNLMNNQPMTILFTQITQSSCFVVDSPILQKASMFALILGSNLGNNLTLIGALAGIMWSSILKDKGIVIAYKQFAKYGFLIMPWVIFFACLVLSLEFYYMNVLQ